MNKFIKAPCYSIEQLNYLIESPTQCQQLFKIIFIRRGSLSLARLDVVALSQQQIISYQYHVNVASLFFKKLTFLLFLINHLQSVVNPTLFGISHSSVSDLVFIVCPEVFMQDWSTKFLML